MSKRKKEAVKNIGADGKVKGKDLETGDSGFGFDSCDERKDSGKGLMLRLSARIVQVVNK